MPQLLDDFNEAKSKYSSHVMAKDKPHLSKHPGNWSIEIILKEKIKYPFLFFPLKKSKIRIGPFLTKDFLHHLQQQIKLKVP